MDQLHPYGSDEPAQLWAQLDRATRAEDTDQCRRIVARIAELEQEERNRPQGRPTY